MSRIVSYHLDVNESIEQSVDEILHDYETGFKSYYGLTDGITLTHVSPEKIEIVSRNDITLEKLVTEAFSLSNDATLERFIYRRGLSALTARRGPEIVRNAISAAIKSKGWLYCFVIGPGSLSR